MSESRRQIILLMLQKDINYFPTIREIRDQIIKAQINEINIQSQTVFSTRTNFSALGIIYSKNWKTLFKLAKLGDLDKPLTPAILSDPSHNVTKHILYLYSMESFIFEGLNKATRLKDKSQIQYYGAFAAALSCIIYFANQNRQANSLRGETKLYRGLRLTKEDTDKFVVGE